MKYKKMIAILLTMTCSACHNTRVIPLSDLEKQELKSMESENASYKVVQKTPKEVHEFTRIEIVESDLVGNGIVKIPANNIEVIEEKTYSPGKTVALVFTGVILTVIGIAAAILLPALANHE